MTTPEQPEPVEGTVRYGRRRRAPRYGSFLVTGAIAGLVLGVILSFSRPSTGQFSANSVVGYVAATLALVGALVGAAVAVLLDRRSGHQPDGSGDPERGGPPGP